MGNMSQLATTEQVKQNLVDKITTDLGLVLDDESEVKEMLYLAYTLGQRDDGLAYFNAVEESTEILAKRFG